MLRRAHHPDRMIRTGCPVSGVGRLASGRTACLEDSKRACVSDRAQAQRVSALDQQRHPAPTSACSSPRVRAVVSWVSGRNHPRGANWSPLGVTPSRRDTSGGTLVMVLSGSWSSSIGLEAAASVSAAQCEQFSVCSGQCGLERGDLLAVTALRVGELSSKLTDDHARRLSRRRGIRWRGGVAAVRIGAARCACAVRACDRESQASSPPAARPRGS
jgi:hypothetical protein